MTVGGNDLEDVDKLLFSHPGITATAKMSTPTEFEKTPKPLAGQFTVTIAGDVPPGTYEAMVIGRFGMSNPRQFAVVRADAQSGMVAVRPQGGDEVVAATFRRDRHVFAVAVSRTTGPR